MLLVYYTGVGSNKSGIHTMTRYKQILTKNFRIPAHLLKNMTNSQLVNLTGAYLFKANVSGKGLTYTPNRR